MGSKKKTEAFKRQSKVTSAYQGIGCNGCTAQCKLTTMGGIYPLQGKAGWLEATQSRQQNVRSCLMPYTPL